MSRFDSNSSISGGLPRPGPVLKHVLIGLTAIWVMFAMAINWGGASPELFFLLCGNSERVWHGEIWRLFTAPVMHIVQGSIGHIFFTLLGLYFLTPTLEAKWSRGRLIRFLIASSAIAYALQMLVELLLPVGVATKIVGDYWFGALPVVEAIAVAFALNFQGSTVRLMFLIPVSSRGLLLFVVGMSVFNLIAAAHVPEGLISPFGGMFAGWLLGSGTPSPLRRLYLKYRLRQLDRQVDSDRKQRVARSGLKVIKGGGKAEQSDDDRGPDGKFLN
jgi:membrane associated rhomboid family serine protease